MLLSHNELLELIECGVIENAKPDAVNSASIDVHLGDVIMVEDFSSGPQLIDYRAREKPAMKKVHMHEDGFVLEPNQFILAQTVEVFHLPLDISAEYKLKSSMARIGLEHLNAGWADAGWHGSVLTLELKNITQCQRILIRPGDAIGQMVFFRHKPVPQERSYAARGRYNGDKTVETIKE